MKKPFLAMLAISFWVLFFFGVLYLPNNVPHDLSPRVLNIFAWGDIFSQEIIQAFEEETGIHVNLTFYSSNEEVLMKLQVGSNDGFDLIVPSEYAVKRLVSSGLLQPLDHDRLPCLRDIDPLLLALPFDPENRFSLPFCWEIFVLGYNKDFFGDQELSWSMLMNPDQHGGSYRISMTNDPIEAMHFASAYLYQDKRSLSQEDLPEIKKVLLAQKPWVEAYSDFRGDYFLSTKNCMLSIASSSYFFRCQSPFVQVWVPKNSFLSIENLCLASASTNTEEAYAFINFVYRDKALKTLHETFFYFPASQHALEFMSPEGAARRVFLEARAGLDNHRFLSQPLAPDLVHSLWIEIKNE